MEKIIIGADHAGFQLKERLIDYMKSKNMPFEDVGCFNEERVDYPSIAETAMQHMKKTPGALAVLCCGSGIGVAMAANRFPFARAVVAHDLYTAEMSRRHNDANVLCMGGRFIAPELAVEILKTWLTTPFEGGRHANRVQQLTQLSSSSPEEVSPSC